MTTTAPDTDPTPAPIHDCPSCGQRSARVFYEVLRVPTNSVLLLETPDEARSLPTGDIRLGHCTNCGHVHNTTSIQL